jgi:sugar-specific transcriptional regulator TrmB
MNISAGLQAIGLHKTESAVYLYILENGLSSPPQIAKGAGLQRTNCYHILLSLKEKGLIEIQEKGKRQAYLASDPEALVRALDKKREAATNLLPDLRALYTTQKNKPKIRFYEGLDQVKEIYWQSLQSKEIFAIGSTKQLTDLDESFLQKYFFEIKKREIFFHDLLSESSKFVTDSAAIPIIKGMYEYKYLPKKYQDPPTDILIWDNHLALINLHEPIFGTILTNSMLADTVKMIFKILWEKL